MDILETLSQQMTKEDRLCYIRKLIDDAHPILDYPDIGDAITHLVEEKNRICKLGHLNYCINCQKY